MTFPFGRWRGHHLTTIPLDYLQWAVGIARELLRQAIENELARRRAREPAAPWRAAGPPEELRSMLRVIVRDGFRVAARRVHPDVGGTHEDMVRLGRARESLEEIVR